MRISGRLLSSLGFVLVGGAMGLPFVRMFYEDEFVRLNMFWRGHQLTIGDEPQLRAEQLLDGRTQEIPAEIILGGAGGTKELFVAGHPGFIVASVLVLAGVLAALLTSPRAQAALAGFAGLAGTLAMGVGQWRAIRSLEFRWSNEQLVEPAYGFWVTTVMLAVLGGLNVAAFLHSQRTAAGLVAGANLNEIASIKP